MRYHLKLIDASRDTALCGRHATAVMHVRGFGRCCVEYVGFVVYPEPLMVRLFPLKGCCAAVPLAMHPRGP